MCDCVYLFVPALITLRNIPIWLLCKIERPKVRLELGESYSFINHWIGCTVIWIMIKWLHIVLVTSGSWVKEHLWSWSEAKQKHVEICNDTSITDFRARKSAEWLTKNHHFECYLTVIWFNEFEVGKRETFSHCSWWRFMIGGTSVILSSKKTSKPASSISHLSRTAKLLPNLIYISSQGTSTLICHRNTLMDQREWSNWCQPNKRAWDKTLEEEKSCCCFEIASSHYKYSPLG